MRYVCFLLCILCASPCAATGLVNQLPADGTWARYQVKLKKEYRGAVMNFTSDFFIASVGRRDDKDGPRRWIEFKMVNKSRKKETLLLKTLVPEDSIEQGLSTWDYAVEGWVRENKGDPYAMDPNRLLPVLRFFLNGDNPRMTTATDPNTPGGTPSFSERDTGDGHVRGTIAYRATFDRNNKPTRVSIEINYECWVDRDSPFGTARANFTLVVRDIEGRIIEHAENTLTLKESGQGALSDLPDYH